MGLKIITNSHYRPFLFGFELSEDEKQEFSYLSDIEDSTFFKYKGNIYDVGEFMPTPQGEPARQELNELSDWHGYHSDSYFSGIVIKYSDDFEAVKVGYYVS